MDSNIDLLVRQLEILQRRMIAHAKETDELTRELGELKAISAAIRDEGQITDQKYRIQFDIDIATASCGDRYAHHEHLWRDRTSGKAKWPTRRCPGRGTDLT